MRIEQETSVGISDYSRLIFLVNKVPCDIKLRFLVQKMFAIDSLLGGSSSSGNSGKKKSSLQRDTYVCLVDQEQIEKDSRGKKTMISSKMSLSDNSNVSDDDEDYFDGGGGSDDDDAVGRL